MKKVLSFMIVFALIFAMVPITPSFAIGFDGGNTDNSYLSVAGELGASITEIKQIQDIFVDFIKFQGSSGNDFDTGISNLIDDLETANDNLKTVLYANGITKINAIADANILKGSTPSDFYDNLKTTNVHSQLGGNLNSSVYPNGSENSLPTFTYYLITMLDDQNIEIMTYDTFDQSLVFDFADKLDNNTAIADSNTTVATLNDYLKLALSSGSFNFDTIKDNLEDSLNVKLSAYLGGSNAFTAANIKDALNASVDNFNLVAVTDSTPDPDDGGSAGGGGSTGGSPSGGTTTTPPATATDDEDFIDDSEAAQEIISDPTATGEEIIDAVDQLTETAFDLIDGDDVDGEEAAAIVKKVVEETIAKAIASNQTTKRQKHQLTKTARRLAERAAIKAGTVNLTGETEITKALVEEAIEKAKAAIKSLEETLSALGLANANRPMKATLTLKFDDEDSEVILSADVIASLKGLNSNLAIGSRGSSILIPSETLATIKVGETIEISSKVVSDGLNAGLNNQAGVKYKFFKTKDIVVSKKKADGTSEQLTRLSLSFDLSDYNGNADQVAALVRNNETEEFELLKSWIVAGQLQFKAPHYSYYTLAEYTPGFNDISNHWAQGVINKMAAKGIVEGRSEEIFDPQGEITRAEFITMLMNAFDYEATITTSFEDTNVNDWFYTPVNAGKALGLVNGVGQNQFNPNTSITRQDMVVMMARFFEEETAERLVASEDMFGDSSNASAYAKSYINGAAEVKIVSGDGEGFKPLNNATRAESLKMIDNLLIYLK